MRQAATLNETGHRPWPLPSGRWFLGQTWEHLLFAHWRVPAAALRDVVPPALEIETFDGSAWVGILPFRLTGFRVRGLLPASRLSSFPEVNLRTYVRSGGRAGIFFLSLDAARDWAVLGARRLYKLPYYRARMSLDVGREIHISSERLGMTTQRRSFRASYRPIGEPVEAERGSLEYFLTERYCAFALAGTGLYRIGAHHPPWLLRPAEAVIEENSLAPAPIELSAEEPLLHYSERQDALLWPLVVVP